jgi:Na+/proline symporter
MPFAIQLTACVSLVIFFEVYIGNKCSNTRFLTRLLLPRERRKEMIPIVFCIFMAAIFYLAFKGYQHVHSAEDFIVAGWDLPLPMVTWSLVAALMAAPFYFAAVGSGYFTGGFEASATMGGLASCMILGAFIWVKPIRRLKAWTIGDYYGLRFADKKLGAFAGSTWLAQESYRTR